MSDLKSVRVALRVRPISEAEIARGHSCVVKVVPSINGDEVTIGDGKISSERFTYSHTFDPKATQQQLYEAVVVDLLDKLFEGFNVTILAYGQTCSGKTFTMGTDYTGDLDKNAGVIPRAVTDIFRIIDDRVAVEGSSNAPTAVSCSFIELYQETVYDLLSKNRQSLDIREGSNGVVLQGITEVPVGSVQATLDCLLRGSTGRCVGATAMNNASSRSHAIFTINISMPSSNDPQSAVKSKFHLVDLAGSERPKKTQATGDRFKEGVKINQGLLALGNVISALSSLASATAGVTLHVPYRDSKLTRLLQDSLGGNSYTLMIACVSPADYNKDETLSTLRYADRVCKIKNKPIVNVDPNRAYINHLETTIVELRQKIAILEGNGGAPQDCRASEGGKVMSTNATGNPVDAHLLQLEEKNQTLQERLQSTLQHLATNEMRALAAEKALEEIETKIQLAQAPTDSKESGNVTFIGETLAAYREERSTLEIPSDYGKEVADELESHGMLPEGVQEASDSHTLQQLRMHSELNKLNCMLAQKEKLRRRCLGQGDAESSVVTIQASVLQARLQEHEHTISALEDQLAAQNEQLEIAKMSDKASKLAEERRRKLRQLESELAEVRQQRLLLQNQLRVKEADGKRVVDLTAEIKAMKNTRVQLLKTMRTEHEKFRQWRQNQEKQICQLKAKDRKRQYEFNRLESMHSMQKQTLLRRMDVEKKALQRKMDETAAVNRRLKAALDGRQRTNVGTVVDRMPLRGAEALRWIDQELELLHSAVEATATLKMLQKCRSEEEEQLAKLKREADAETQNGNEQPMRKIREEWITFFEESLRVRNETIADLEQKLRSVNTEEQLATFSDALATLPELREAIRRLLDAVVQKDAALIEERFQKSEANSKTAVPLAPMVEYQHQQQLLEESQRTSRGYPVCKKPKIAMRFSSVEEQPDEEADTDWNDILESESEEDLASDPTFRGTPMHKRKKATTNIMAFPSTSHCSCSGICSSKRCGCKKNDNNCSAACKCPEGCANGKAVNKHMTGPSEPTEQENHPSNSKSEHVVGNVNISSMSDEMDILTYVKYNKKRKPLIDL
uniref:Uncharacterized protein n=1 Tax=Anopheles atroparvus TaxID=41427 RepID=A0A182J473_ANOAO